MYIEFIFKFSMQLNSLQCNDVLYNFFSYEFYKKIMIIPDENMGWSEPVFRIIINSAYDRSEWQVFFYKSV